MHFDFFNLLIGITIGIIISIPLGPVGLIVMRRTAQFGLRAGIFSGLAIVFLDTLAAIFILLGLNNSMYFFTHLPRVLHIGGAIIIFIYGLRMFFNNPIETIDNNLPWQKHFLSSTVLALTNPSTYFSFGVIALLMTRFIDQPLLGRVEIAVGFFIGSLIWWFVLAFIAFTNRKKLLAHNMQKIVGIIIMLLSLLSFIPSQYIPHISIIKSHKI